VCRRFWACVPEVWAPRPRPIVNIVLPEAAIPTMSILSMSPQKGGEVREGNFDGEPLRHCHSRQLLGGGCCVSGRQDALDAGDNLFRWLG
jgi:hypothetical protein